jgi:hypothetical protein
MSGALDRMPWPTAPDGVRLLVPAVWKTGGAGPIATSTNVDLREGSLPAAKADLEEVIAAGPDLPEALLEASGPIIDGTRIGLAVAVYDLGEAFTPSSLRGALEAASPGAAVEETVVAYTTGVNLIPRTTTAPRRVISDHWLAVPHRPHHVAVVRFWSEGDGGEKATAMADFMMGGFAFIVPAHWSGMQATLTRRLYKPASAETASEGDWRLTGWRLGQTFSTAAMKGNMASYLSAASYRPSDILPVAGIFVIWFIASIALIGLEARILLPGAVAFFHGALTVRKAGRIATIRMAGFLAALLLLGVAME